MFFFNYLLVASLVASTILAGPVQKRAANLRSSHGKSGDSGTRRSLEDLAETIDDFVLSIMSQQDTPGLNLAVIRDNEKLTRGYGVTSLEPESPIVTPDTLFYIASTTKAMTACLLAQTLYQNNLSLSTPVKQLLPDFQVAEFYRQENAMVSDMLSHMMGIPESLYNWVLGETAISREDVVQRALYFKPSLPFRASNYYSNLFYIASGLIIERLTGKSWETAMQENLFGPLGMENTITYPELTPEQLSQMVTPNEPDWRNGNVMRAVPREFLKHAGIGGPAGDVVSSANDLAHWLYMLAHRGVNEAGERVIDEAVIDQMMTPINIMYLKTGPEPYVQVAENYALGWNTGFYRGYRMVTHAGYMFGYHSQATVIPQLKLSIFTCSNGEQNNGVSGLNAIHDFISELVLNDVSTPPQGLNPVMQSSEDIKFLRLGNFPDRQKLESLLQNAQVEVTAKSAMKDEFLDEFVGVYGNFAYGNVSVFYNESTERLQANYGDLGRIDVFHIGADWFVGRADYPLWFFPPMEMRFGRRASDNVVFNVTVPILLDFDPPVFVRDLKMADAPLPPTCDC